MPHPLFTLLSQRTETAPESPPAGSETPLADSAALAAPTQQRTCGEPEPGAGWPLPDSDGQGSGVAIMAVIDPPGPGAVPGTPGRCHFAPGLTADQRREILFDLEWFDVRCRNREKAKAAKAKAR